jgi:hypothetical protein
MPGEIDMPTISRLEVLCKVHGQTGGTIHEFNREYKVDFLAMSMVEFINAIQYIIHLRNK